MGTSLASRPLGVDLSIVIPAFNETRRIIPTIASIVAHLAGRDLRWEIVVSDDGSTDGMADALTRLRLENLRVVGGERNEGKGAAVRRGMLAARGCAVLCTDADMSTPIAELDRMLDRLDRGADVVVASRVGAGSAVVAKSTARKVVSVSLRAIVSVLLPTGVEDTQCGFKLFRGDVARRLAGVQTIDGFSFDLELLYVARRWGLRVDEVGVRWIDAPGSTVDPARESLRFLRDIVRIRARSLSGAYRPATDPVDGLHVAVVTPHPPSPRTLNEYGFHLVAAFATKPEIGRVTLLCDEEGASASGVGDRVRPVAAWRFGSWSSAVRLVRVVRRERPDVVFFNIQFATFGDGRVSAALGLFAPMLVRLSGTPSVVLLHNLVDTVDLDKAGFTSSRLVGRVYLAIGRVLTRVVLAANKVAVTIPAYVDVLVGRYGASNVYLAPHGTFNAVEVDTSVGDGPRRILTFGKFGTYKRVEPLIDAYRSLLDAGYDDVELVVAGTDAANAVGYLDRVREANSDLAGVSFTGYVAEEDVESVFRSASVVVFPYSATTGSSGPLHQAGSFGRAVVLPAIGDFIDVVSDEGFAAETFDPDDVSSLAAAIAALLDDDERRERIARQNAAAAGALPLTGVADWHLLHMRSLVRARRILNRN